MPHTFAYLLCFSAFAYDAHRQFDVLGASFSNVTYLLWRIRFCLCVCVCLNLSRFRSPHINSQWLWFVSVPVCQCPFVYGLLIKNYSKEKKCFMGAIFRTVSSITLTFPITKISANMLRWTSNTSASEAVILICLFVYLFLFVYLIALVWVFDYSIF